MPTSSVRDILKHLSIEIDQLIAANGVADRVVGYEIGLVTIHGMIWGLKLPQGSVYVHVLQKEKLVKVSGESIEDSLLKLVQESYQKLFTTDTENSLTKFILENNKIGIKHRELISIDQITLSNTVAGIKLSQGFRAVVKNVYGHDNFIFIPILWRIRSEFHVVGGLFLVTNNVLSNAEIFSLRQSLLMLIHSRYDQEISALADDPIAGLIGKFLNESISNKWFLGKFHLPPFASEHIQTLANYFSLTSQDIDSYKGMYYWATDSSTGKINWNAGERQNICTELIASTWRYFSTCSLKLPDNEKIGMPYSPAWIFLAGLANFISKVGAENIQKLEIKTELDSNVKQNKWWLETVFLHEEGKDGAIGLLSSLHGMRRQGEASKALDNLIKGRLGRELGVDDELVDGHTKSLAFTYCIDDIHHQSKPCIQLTLKWFTLLDADT